MVTSSKLFFGEDLGLLNPDISGYFLLFHHFKYIIIAGWLSVLSLATAYIYITMSQDQRIFMTRLLFVLWCLSALCGLLFYWYGYQTNLNNNFSGIFKDRNIFATCYVLMLALYLFQAKPFETKAMTILSCVLLVLSFALISYTQSLTGLIVKLVLIVCMVFSRIQLRHKLFILAAMMVAFVPSALEVILRLSKFLIAAINADLLLDMINTSTNDKYAVETDSGVTIYYNSSPAIRFSLIMNGAAVAANHFVAGVGLDNLRFFTQVKGFENGTFAHMNYIDILASGGVPTFILHYGVFFALPFYVLVKKQCRQILSDNGWLVLFIFLLLFSITTHLTISTYAIFFFYFQSQILFILSITTLLKARSAHT
ncbi:MAG: O-antigen ligase family protein [Candidatus Puniceispirillaceae bacterium]